MKKVNAEVQCLCNRTRQIRGIEYLTLELLNYLVKRGNNHYSASFFDYNRERGNRELLEDYFSNYGILQHLKLHECNSLDYRNVIKGWESDMAPEYASMGYEEYVHADADIYYFPHTVSLPVNLPYDKTIVTICDILHLRNEQARKNHPDAAAQIERIISYIAKRKDIFITAISEATKKDLVEYVGIDPSRIEVVSLAYNKHLFWPEKDETVLEQFGIRKPYILYLGGLDAHKGIDVLCDAYDKLGRQDVQLVLAGGRCAWFNIDPIISSMKQKDNVILPGYVTDQQKRILMSMADIFVFPSYYEGFGLPVIEAMACGAPVISSNVTSLPEVGGDAAHYFEAGKSEELCGLLEQVLEDSTYREELRKKSIERAEQFSWDLTAQKMERVFENHAAH